MKKLFILCPFFLLMACSHQVTAPSTSPDAQQRAENREQNEENIQLSITPRSYPAAPQKVELTLTNSTGDTIQFGAGYSVERLDPATGAWEKISFFNSVAVIAIMYMLPAGASQTYDIQLFPNQVSYEPGSYRIRKNIFIGEENREFHAQFELE